MHGFRPGKVPLRVVQQQYGTQVRNEVLGDRLQKCFGDAVRDNNLRVAGFPRFETKPTAEGSADLEYSATFEVYPEVRIGELADVPITRPELKVGDTEVHKTIEILRKQRVTFEPVSRAAAKDDLVTLDFSGQIEEKPFAGGDARDMQVVLGAGRLLPEFEQAVVGMSPDESRSFDITYPADYHGKEVAGKTARFSVTLNLGSINPYPD